MHRSEVQKVWIIATRIKLPKGGLVGWRTNGFPVDPYKKPFHLNSGKNESPAEVNGAAVAGSSPVVPAIHLARARCKMVLLVLSLGQVQ